MKRRLLFTILSISLLTVMAGAVIYLLQTVLTRKKLMLPDDCYGTRAQN